MGMFDGLKNFFGMGNSAAGAAGDEPQEPYVTPEEELEEPSLESDAEIVAHVDRLYTEWYEARYAYEPAWYQNVANYLGFQYHVWNDVLKNMDSSRAPSYRVRMVINLMMPAVKTYLGKFMRGDPQFRARPGEPSDASFADARVADKVLRGLWRMLDGTEEELEFVLCLIVYGHSFWKTSWDATLGKLVEFPGQEPVQTGEVAWDTFGPWRILVPPEQKNIRRPSQLIDCEVVTMLALRRQFPERARQAKADSDLSDKSTYEHRLSTLVSPQVNASGSRRARVGWGTKKMEWWSDPETMSDKERNKYPHGRLVVVAGGALMYKGDNPFTRDAKHPYVDCVAEAVPGRYWGASILDQVAPMQKSYNRGRSQLIEARALTAAPQIDVEQGHGVTTFTGEPGAVSERKKGWAPPQYRAMPQMSPHLAETVSHDKADFAEVIQQNAATKGEVVGSNVTGVALELMQESDNNPMNPMALRISRAFSRVMTKTVSRVQQFYTEERYIEITGEGQETEVMLFRADQHQSVLRVDCIVTSVLPASVAARHSRLEAATRLGYLNPVKDRALGLRMLEFGDDDQIYELADRDRQKQIRENQRMRAGQPVQTAPFDDHEVHVLAMMSEMKSAEWDAWPPEVQQAFLTHWQAHLDALASINQAMGGAEANPPLGRKDTPTDTPAVAGGLGQLTQGGEV